MCFLFINSFIATHIGKKKAITLDTEKMHKNEAAHKIAAN